MSHPVATFYTTEKVSTIVNVLKTERHDGFPVVQRNDENVCTQFYIFSVIYLFVQIFYSIIINCKANVLANRVGFNMFVVKWRRLVKGNQTYDDGRERLISMNITFRILDIYFMYRISPISSDAIK